ncbi:ABC transporter permease [Kineobactrum sediminis]|uniref:ABC transporter permease n=1 Tax=Kineobactrum sediminis TaxID=1905677 RepID=A0A2N5XZE4_9GAMM|nr:FtsX-like permease family protein [Kineobactrum sediminis]PLW81503.1 ABC transporter permease [Kineobactrum sediminis]
MLIALRNLRRHFRRSLTSLLAIAFGVAAMLTASGFNEAMFDEFREATIRSQFGHIQITRPGFHDKGRSDPYAYLLPREVALDEALLPGGAALAPRLLVNGLASFGEVTLPFMAEGIDPAVDMVDDRSLRMVEGRRLAAGDERQLVLGRGLASQLEVAVGDAIVLLANTPEGHLGAAEAEVVGIFSSFSKEFDDAALLMPIGLARSLVQVEGAHAWLVFLETTGATNALLPSVRDALPAAEFEVQPWHALAEFYARASELFAQQLQLVKGIVVAIILLGIGNTMMMSVLERTGEIGTVMALGTRRAQVLRGFLLEGALLGLLGALIGVVVAFGLGGLLALAQVEMPPPPSFARSYDAALLLTPSMVLETVVIAAVATTLASLYPALRASRMVIVDAIRNGR